MFYLFIYCVVHFTERHTHVTKAFFALRMFLLFPKNTLLFHFMTHTTPSKIAPFPALPFTILTNVQKHYLKISNSNRAIILRV